ncbi:peptidylprolyl isomerase [Coraliomargarita sp. SDUM461003]|uniref:Peptidylprolyl isomerase n=1 Tax=Thalassobacterium maritimum TaxID=3041265 RepID=A0ABU1ATD4_9BACT|nr:peptidylprolyl isomerase [Coraliomargarita sp. SDUM461003]MDQ8207421.1 peptidylprolyl isomerase [Coraliomargarita sp. SDUM461003]
MKEPVVHFALIAFVMLGVHSIYQSFSKPEIVLTEAQVEQMKVAAEKETLETGNQIETAQLVRTYIEDQILLEEALRRDLTESSQVKELLVELIRNELKPVLREPSDEELIELRQTTPEEYRFPPRLSFEHVSYRKDSTAIPDNLLAQLNSGKTPSGLGDPIRLANPLPLTYKPQLDRLLGEAVSDSLFELELGQWQGPYLTDRGTHFVRIIEKIGPMDMPFEQVRRTLQSNWESAQQQAAVDAAIHELAKPYLIEVPAPYVDVVP